MFTRPFGYFVDFFFFLVVFLATVVVVEVGAVVGFVASVVADDVGLANASVEVGPMFSPVAYEVVGPMLTTFLLIVGILAIVVGGAGNVVFAGEVDSVGMRRPVAYEVVGPAFTAPLLMAAFFVLRTAPPLSEPPQALMATRETTVNEKAMTRGVIRIA